MFKMLNEFNVAIEKAKEVNGILKEQGYYDCYIPLSKIVAVVKQCSNYDIIEDCLIDFSKIVNNNKFNVSDAAAMLSTHEKDDKREAKIFINDRKNRKIQRFAMVHELGHLITSVPNYQYEIPNDGRFTLSTLVSPDVTLISDKDCQKNKFYMAEQIANIFALLVLIPENIKISDLSSLNKIEELSDKYGVVSEALFSRMLLSSMLEEA